MSFDYGSIDLGIKNPFKKEGMVKALRGAVIIPMGIYLLFAAAASVKTDMVSGWILVVFGLFLLGSGLHAAGSGIMAMLRYFVGRNHPTSLAANASPSAGHAAKEELGYVAYTRLSLTEMLVGRKNITFVEPIGLLARFLHSIFPKLTFMPYPVRNMAQGLFGAWVKTLVAILVYIFVAFVSFAGFAGEIGRFIFPIYSLSLIVYLLWVWRAAGQALHRKPESRVSSLGVQLVIKVVAGAIILPVLIALGLQMVMSSMRLSVADMQQITADLPSTYSLLYMIAILLFASVSTSLIVIMLRKRLEIVNPCVEVSELRENWQESVHPKEIFINLDNLVMADRRYKEVPNRVYGELKPNLDEQVTGKGSFFGEMIQEVQPMFKAMELGEQFNQYRLWSLIAGNLLFVVGAILTLILAITLIDVYDVIRHAKPSADAVGQSFSAILFDQISPVIHLFFVGMLIQAFARVLSNAAHLFFAEMLFESHLIYVKVEGTFTESKISTGASIHDSTRSENTLVRSSITPWVIVTRVVSSTFADSGMQNLEYPRYILEMHKNDSELNSIRNDVISFLKDRESIAAITSERDLRNASQIHKINQQSRAIPMQPAETLIKMDEEAGGFLRQEAEQTEKASE